jgi:hypothetical protein
VVVLPPERDELSYASFELCCASAHTHASNTATINFFMAIL